MNEMSMWQFIAAVDGYVEAHSTDKANSLSQSEQDELADWLGI